MAASPLESVGACPTAPLPVVADYRITKTRMISNYNINETFIRITSRPVLKMYLVTTASMFIATPVLVAGLNSVLFDMHAHGSSLLRMKVTALANIAIMATAQIAPAASAATTTTTTPTLTLPPQPAPKTTTPVPAMTT